MGIFSLIKVKFVSKLGISEDTKQPEKPGEITYRMSMELSIWLILVMLRGLNKAEYNFKVS